MGNINSTQHTCSIHEPYYPTDCTPFGVIESIVEELELHLLAVWLYHYIKNKHRIRRRCPACWQQNVP